MTFAAYETSRQDGAPIELYDFFFGTLHYRYTNAPRTTTFAGEDFVPQPLQRGGIDQRTSFDNSTLRLRAHKDIGIAGLYKVQPPSGEVTLIVRSQHVGDPDDEFAVAWTGRLLEVAWKGNEVELNCEPHTISMKRTGLVENYQKTCTRRLYSSGLGQCNVDKELFNVEGAVSLVSATVVSLVGADAKPVNWFAGGYIEYVNSVNGVTEYRPVESSAGLQLTLMLPVVNLATTAKAYAGCARNTETCINKFDNLDNYGGIPTLPTINPFSGTDIF